MFGKRTGKDPFLLNAHVNNSVKGKVRAVLAAEHFEHVWCQTVHTQFPSCTAACYMSEVVVARVAALYMAVQGEC